MFSTISELINHHEKIGTKFFDKDTMKYWGTEIHGDIINRGSNQFFITSEYSFDGTARLFTIRKIAGDKISTEWGFQDYDSLADARESLNNWEDKKKKENQKIMNDELNDYRESRER